MNRGNGARNHSDRIVVVGWRLGGNSYGVKDAVLTGLPHRPQITHSADQSDITVSSFIPIYLQYLKAKRPTNDGRNELILAKHILPYFGQEKNDRNWS